MFQERIQKYYDNLTPGFRRLADFILNETLDVAFLTATELSRRVNVDPATVVRFSQEIGYSGYRELSREIKRYVRDRINDTNRRAIEAATEGELLEALLDRVHQDLEQFTATETPRMALAVSMLKSATRLWIAGEYPSYDLAEYVAECLAPLGIPITCFAPSMIQTANAISQMEEGDTLVAITFGTPGVDTGYAVKLARDKGLHTLCITDTGTALPAREAELTITTPSKSPVAPSSYATSLLAMSLLCEAVLNANKDKAEAHQEATRTEMNAILKLRAESAEQEIENPEEA
ncbi:MAG: MurR/RpiR family transcriptional regulator [Anaerolineae bacterium]|nr:MurR/RpiR family transcriptional regulator [Anaerolineae bacterium]